MVDVGQQPSLVVVSFKGHFLAVEDKAEIGENSVILILVHRNRVGAVGDAGALAGVHVDMVAPRKRFPYRLAVLVANKLGRLGAPVQKGNVALLTLRRCGPGNPAVCRRLTHAINASTV
ncbi:MAG: hypothetical protein CL678_11195 [Bdellovibrionaceae bacterium]|nr:hypothetical protein [Pseudobdellovibrionaceae bacterium]